MDKRRAFDSFKVALAEAVRLATWCFQRRSFPVSATNLVSTPERIYHATDEHARILRRGPVVITTGRGCIGTLCLKRSHQIQARRADTTIAGADKPRLENVAPLLRNGNRIVSPLTISTQLNGDVSCRVNPVAERQGYETREIDSEEAETTMNQLLPVEYCHVILTVPRSIESRSEGWGSSERASTNSW